MLITWASLYLGILLGPGVGDDGWAEPMEKFERRSLLWSRLKLGIHYDVRLYSTFCFSVLSFYVQFYRVTEEVLEFERRAVARIFSGAW